ncbi:MAG: M48 family metallopeptidase, partial [Isosphaeraceae bacterium]|nr:M48 family metallopeptidase [Isosphaeraceae bacterium]
MRSATLRVSTWAIVFGLILLAPGASRAGATARSASTARPAPQEASVLVPEPSETALRYYRGNNWLWCLDEAWALAVPALLLWSGSSARLRNAARALGRHWLGTIAVYAALYVALVSSLSLPLHYYQGFWRQHAYGLSNQTFGKWLSDAGKRTLVSMLLGALFLWVPYLLIARSPRRWWLWLGGLLVPYVFAMVLLKPIWYDPLFNRFGPMQDKALEAKILTLAKRAGISGARIFQVDKSRDTKTVNAYVTGFLGTKRIVLWDTLLAKLDDDEILCVLGHEMGHYVLNHVAIGTFASCVLTLIGLYFVHTASRPLIRRYSRRFGFNCLADVASVPLLVLLGQLFALAMTPATNAFSRGLEHEADRFALEITRANHACASAFVKLQRDNLSIPRPDPLARTWRWTHPPLGERIDFCNTYHPWTEGDPGIY